MTDLRKSFGSTVAVDGLSLEVRTGEVFGLLGPNGAGKTTTIGMAIGLLAPDSGSVQIMPGGAPTSAEVRRRIGVAPQALALYDELSGEENLRFFGRLYGLRSAELSARVKAVLEHVELSARGRDRVAGYSGGMKRRLNLAVALLHDPPLLLLDEPTAGVDPHSRASILDLVGHLSKSGRTIVYTTHYMEEAQRICDRVGVIDHGRLLALGTVDELIARHGGHSLVTILRDDGETRIETPDPLRALSEAAASGGVTDIRVQRPSLESVFLALTGRSLRD